MLLPHYGSITEEERKGDGIITAVTRLDRDIEVYLRDALAKEYPAIPFAGEEFGGSRESDLFWLCDPIDATGHFIHGLPFCTVMLALIQEQRVVFSLVYDFLNDVAYHAERGMGAYANDRRMQVSNRPISHSYMILETHPQRAENQRIFDALYKRSGAGVLQMLSAGWTFAMVASGKLDGRITVDPWGFDYDFAPGSQLVEEAGGIVANIGKTTYDYRDGNFIAANPVLFKDLTEGPDAVFPIVQPDR
jgi:fructose-1,6-bisphosphatase/inositol monophosphatase family enzyme